MEKNGKAVAKEEEMIEPKSMEEMAFDSLLRALSDLAKGQKDMLEEIKSQNWDRATSRGFLCGETLGASQPFDQPPPAAQRPLVSVPTRATLPSFVPIAQIKPAREDTPQMRDYFREWQVMDEYFKEALSFRDYCKLKQSERNKGYGGQGTQNYELQRTIGRMYFPTFDGTAKCTARAWVEKMDTYFQLNWIVKQEAIKMAVLHLEGEAHDWCFHGLTTLGHAQIVSYEDFTRRMVEHFNQRDPEASFRELTQLR